jgi:hypothetical protein
MAQRVALGVQQDHDPEAFVPNPKGFCRAGHDLSLPGARKLAHKGDGRYYWRCIACRAESKQRERAANRNNQRERERERGRRRRAAAAEAAAASFAAVADGRTDAPAPVVYPKEDFSPYGVAQRALEAHWKLPIDRWGRQHHIVHNRAMYHVLGWPKTGPARSHLPPLPDHPI